VEIEYVVKELYKKGLKAYLIETTNQKLGIPSVIVIVPGARLNRPSTKLHPYLLIARQLMDIKLYKEALFYIEKTFEDAPSYRNLPQILSQAATCAKLAGNYKKSLEYYENLLEVSPQLMQSPKFVNEFMQVIEKVSPTS
jgi:ribosomal protein S12 methylthiotransferase accessory factor